MFSRGTEGHCDHASMFSGYICLPSGQKEKVDFSSCDETFQGFLS